MIERFIRKMFVYFGEYVKSYNFEFGSLTDEHFQDAKLPSSLIELNLNGCREISEKVLI